MITVVSLGGSIVAPNEPDVDFLSRFSEMVRDVLAGDSARKLILVVGGGGPARTYQKAYKAVVETSAILEDEADWVGIMATRLNAQLLRALFSDICKLDVIYDPTKVREFPGRIMVAAGWKPGFSTDNDAVLLAERFAAKTVINISNIKQVYTDDPKTNPDAKPIAEISWADFRKMVGDEWMPGKNTPFDPVASKHAQKAGITVFCVGGKDIPNIKNTFTGKQFFGTKIC
jgi:uridylate kinase